MVMGLKEAALAAAAVVALKLLAEKLNLLKKDAYGGLSGIVSYTSRLIAASRAVETEEKLPLVTDPLAGVLAGSDAIARSKSRTQKAPRNTARRYKISMMAIRTKWFDDQIEAALGMPVEVAAPAALTDPDAPKGLGSYIWTPPPVHKPHQVVMLGAGMDTRPWRMKLPAELKWFEVDRPDVLGAKQAMLAAAGAEVPRPQSGDEAQQGLLRTVSLDKVKLPLRTNDWNAVPADLSAPSWLDDLLAAGFDPHKPTVWVAEGLLMYLDPSVVEQVLKAAAGVSAPGSILLALSVTQDVIHDLVTKGTKSELMKTWKFGVPANTSEFFATKGWQLQHSTDRPKMAAALRLRRDLCTFNVDDDHQRASRSLFLVATVEE